MAILSIGNNIILTKLTADIRQCGNVAEQESDEAEHHSNHMLRHALHKSAV